MESTDRKPGGLAKFQVTDREECGLIIRNEEVLYVLRVPNRAEDSNDYEIHKVDYDLVKDVLSPDESIVGFFHTHLEAHKCEPSETDLESAKQNPEMLHLVYKPSTEEFCWYGEMTKR